MGIERGCINSILVLEGGEMRRGNDEIARLLTRYPERFVGFAAINPRARAPAEEVKRCVTSLGMLGVKIHPRMHITPLTDASYEPVFEAAMRLGVPVMSHSTRTDPLSNGPAFEAVARRYPHLTLIMAHGGNDSPGVLEGIRIAKRCPNIVLDVTGVGYWHAGLLELGVNELGADRFFYGSDLAIFDQASQLGYIGYARLSDTEKRKILGGTVRRLIGLPQQSG
jgi:predicted TIM-barrel fold metal-dependent hydrolase